ncbi:MAG: ribosome small subunit-dependent GTPase A [Gaiellaceae bacterium]
MTDLHALGWDDVWAAAFAEHRALGLVPGRVAVPHRGAYDVWTEDGEVRAGLPGRARRDAATSAELPVVGDWVAVERGSSASLIRGLLPRRSQFSRRTSPDPSVDAGHEQVVAANVDVVFVTVALSEQVDTRLLERYLTLAWESGARPVIVLTKADLEEKPATIAAEVATIGGDVPVHVVSSTMGLGLEDIRAHLRPGVTGALVGPSGVGKSSLVNALVGEERLETGAVREDGAGRHTTTRRELVLLPGGGLIVDNPGMRELHLWLADEGLEEAFADVAALFAKCRFADCRHDTEPGCAVQAAIASGALAAERWASYRELQRELTELEERLARRARSRSRGRRPPR